MVTRKAVPSEAVATPALGSTSQKAPSAAPQSQQPLPYPTTPVAAPGESFVSTTSDNTHHADHDIASSHDFDLIDINEARERTRRDSDISSHGTWDSDDSRVTLGDLDDVVVEDEDEDEDAKAEDIEDPTRAADIPQPLHIKPSRQSLGAGTELQPRGEANSKGEVTSLDLPASLRPGGSVAAPTLAPPLQSQNHLNDPLANPWQQDSKNPYHRHNTSQDASHTEGSDLIFPTHSQREPLSPIPPSLLPAAGKAKAAPVPPSEAPPAPPPGPPPPPPPAGIPTAVPYPHDSNVAPVELPTPSNDFANLSIHKRAPAVPLVSLETAESLGIPEHFPGLLLPISSQQAPSAPPFPSTNPWRSNSGPSSATPAIPDSQRPPSSGAFSPIEPEHATTQDQSAAFQTDQRHSVPPSPIVSTAETQYLPPPGPPPSSRTAPLIDHSTSTTAFSNEAREENVNDNPTAVQPEVRNEHYQIKHVSWMQNSRLRQSPVLTQNANGPCPLLALVNALVLSTPQDLDTALVEALRTREQVSLGLLLDIVFDELMSGRRGDTATRLPDVSELYAFLRALHTGMNVNPSFIIPAGVREDTAGCFEETKEMRLYSTFHIPLIHGWLPPKHSLAYAAFERSALTFEDAQNIQFLQSELEDKLQAEGLPQTEQQLLQDIHTMKNFFVTWPTQLTDHGLQAVEQSLKPGQVAILFRNDHFSTLYKEPTRGALMTLVTDAGYSSHEEIVWESLVDVNGAASELFSGDFRTVSHSGDTRLEHGNTSGSATSGDAHAQSDPQDLMMFDEPSHAAPPSQSFGNGASSLSAVANAPPNADANLDAQRRAAEQEDHDLALALQLQEEEEDRHRRDEERRRHEQELTEQLLSGEGEGENPPAMPPRRNGNEASTTNNNNRNSTAQTPLPAPLPPRPNRAQSGRRPARSTWGNERPAVSRPTEESNGEEVLPSYEQAASDRPYRPGSSSALDAYDALAHQQQNNAAGGGRRYSSQGQGPHGPTGAHGHHRPINGAPGAPSVRDADERCVIM